MKLHDIKWPFPSLTLSENLPPLCKNKNDDDADEYDNGKMDDEYDYNEQDDNDDKLWKIFFIKKNKTITVKNLNLNGKQSPKPIFYKNQNLNVKKNELCII